MRSAGQHFVRKPRISNAEDVPDEDLKTLQLCRNFIQPIARHRDDKVARRCSTFGSVRLVWLRHRRDDAATLAKQLNAPCLSRAAHSVEHNIDWTSDGREVGGLNVNDTIRS